MSNVPDPSLKFYLPYCKEKLCKGLLKIKINDNFTVDFECDKNVNHKGKKIFFKNFENLYLIEKKTDICPKCNFNLENDNKYKCKICDNFYCPICFIYDEHIKNNINNLEIITHKCLLHKREYTEYCEDCKIYLCCHCVKDDNRNSVHQSHNIQNLISLMPTTNQIDYLINEIKKHSIKCEELIKSINQWQKTIITKSEELKRGLKNQINLLQKMIYNYNQFFSNYSYYSNFHFISDYLKEFNNKYADLFENLFNFETQTKILINLFGPKKHTVEELESKIKTISFDEKIIMAKINDDYLVQNFCESNKIKLINYDGQYNSISSFDFNKKIYSLSNSINDNHIYACLLNERKINILEYNLDEKYIKLCDYEIEDEMELNTHFNKCIDISNEYIASCDEDTICIWGKEEEKNNNYNINVFYEDKTNETNDIIYKFPIINRIIINTKTSDLLLVNNEYFISTQPNNCTITFIDIGSLAVEKIIPNIDCYDSINSLFLFKENIMINCIGGIAIISLKTKDLVQYIELFNFRYKKTYCYNNESLFFLNLGVTKIIFEFKIIDNLLDIYAGHKIKKNKDYFDIILMNKKELILYCHKNGDEEDSEENVESLNEEESEENNEEEIEEGENEENEDNSNS